jgi:(2Fe-2S) ferredoxin
LYDGVSPTKTANLDEREKDCHQYSMPPFERHIFVCTNQRPEAHPRGCCHSKGSESIRECFKNEIKQRDLKDKVRANAAGCLDNCEWGPTVVIYPEGVWYRVQTPEDVKEIMEEHIALGRVVGRLAIYPTKP